MYWFLFCLSSIGLFLHYMYLEVTLILPHIGGSGQRKLNLLSPEEEGYTGASLVRTWAGKGCLYIMPIQHTLDTSPLPFTAPEFQATPRARCLTCKEYVPLQLLSIHVKTCFSKIRGEVCVSIGIKTVVDCFTSTLSPLFLNYHYSYIHSKKLFLVIS